MKIQLIPVDEEALHHDLTVVLLACLVFAVFMAVKTWLKERKK